MLRCPGARALHAALEPADDGAIGQGVGDGVAQRAFVRGRRPGATARVLDAAVADRPRDGLVGPRGAPRRVRHAEGRHAGAFVEPDVQGGAERRAVVSGRRLDEDAREGRVRPDLPVHHAVHRAAARQAQVGQRHAGVGAAEDVPGRLLENVLERCRHVLVLGGDGRARLARRPEQFLEARRVDVGHLRRARLPLHRHLARPVPEVREVELEAAIDGEADEPGDAVGVDRPAIRRQAHHLELVAVVLEAEVLRQGEIEQPERVGKPGAREDVEAVAASVAHRGTDEVAEAVDGAAGGFGHPAGVVGARQVGGMMLHVAQSSGGGVDVEIELAAQRLGDASPLRGAPAILRGEGRGRPVPEREPGLAQQVRAASPRHGPDVDVARRRPGLAQAGQDGPGRKPGDVLDAGEALFLEGRDELPVLQYRRRHVAMPGVEADDQHGSTVASAWRRQPARRSMVKSARAHWPARPMASASAGCRAAG